MRLKTISIMKRIKLYRIFPVLIAVIALLASCTKENSDVRLAPQLATSQTLNVTSDSATVVGFVVAQGSGFDERGVCYSTQSGPTISDSKVVYTGSTKQATFNVTLSGLDYATKYYVRSYATNGESTVYGEDMTFTTDPIAPALTTTEITEITGNSATGGGNVTVQGGAEVTARGVCYSTSENPTIENDTTKNAQGTGVFVSSLSGLKGNTTYYVRAYATNSAGTGYGPQVSFTTLVDLPAVTTSAVINVTKTGAISGGEVNYDGGGDVTARGLAWGTSENPTINDNVLDGGSGTGVFISTLDGLELNTTYHVRAYATNSAGTAYGDDISFTTLADITKFWVVGDYNGWDNSDNAKYIISTATSNGLAEGYVYLKQGGIKLVTDHSWDDAHTFGDDGSGGLTNPGGNISVPADGYYRIQANLSDMTYSLLQTDWGIIGNATPGGWSTDTPMSYDQTGGVWIAYATLTQKSPPDDGMKFRANGSWDLNYGDTNADGSLEKDGTNIGVPYDGDYEIVLDCRIPNEYTYSLTSWGLIGDATPGGWSTDTPMTWDAANKVWTVTVDLVSDGGTKTFKFRANQGWDLNYGGTGSGDGTADNYSDATTAPLAAGGKNLGVPNNTDGNYTITFDPVELKATVVKN